MDQYKNITITNAFEINMNSYYEYLLNKIEKFQGIGSGWRIEGILSCNVNVSQYTPLKGSSYIDLPEKIKNKQCCVNVQNFKDNKCFLWFILSALYPQKLNPHRLSAYKNYENGLNFDDISFPVKLDKISKFEKLNNININIFRYDENYNIFPLQISKNNFEKVIDLLLINHDNNNYYCWIKNFDGLISKQYNEKSDKCYHCKRCLHGYSTKELLEKHYKNCTTEPTRIVLPDEKEKFMKFKNDAHQLKVHFVIYADFESLTVPINSAAKNSNTVAYQHHEPCGFAYKVVCCEDQYTKPIELYRGKKCVEKFLDCIMQEKKYVNKIINHNKNYTKITKQDQENYKYANICHIS